MIRAGRYRHHEGHFCDVIGIARHSETGEKLVVCRPRHGDRELPVRPLAGFIEPVMVDGAEVPRFASGPEPV